MQRLEQVHLVQFFLFEAETLRFDPTTAIIAPNGAGKSALLDALQIVLLGGDRSRIRFNAQAGGSHRARTIRDYCLGVYRSGEEGRKRRTATTYISLVFRDEVTGQPLTAGIALGASAEEADHRIYGLYLLPGVALTLEDHIERADGRELPLAWASFRELAARHCRDVGTTSELHTTAERFVKDLLFRLRAAPGAQPDVNAYRKAFQNALNLQRVEDVDLFVRTLVAEDRPTDIARFRSVLETFRQLKERIEQVVRRIDAADGVHALYGKIAAKAARAASLRALGAEYERDLLGEQVESAEHELGVAREKVAELDRQLKQVRIDRESTQRELEDSRRQLQGSEGYAEQAGFDALAERDREQLAQIKQALMKGVEQARQSLAQVATLNLPSIDAGRLRTLSGLWESLFSQLSQLSKESTLPWEPEALHTQLHETLEATTPIRDIVEAHWREQHAVLETLRQRERAARSNRDRLAAGQSELSESAVRLQNILQEAGITATPVCDCVHVTDPAWQPAIEAYLRGHVEALLVSPEHEHDAIRIYRGLQGNRAVYGVKLALASQSHKNAGAPEPGSVAGLIGGDRPEAVAYLKRQLGRMICADTEGDLVRARQGLSRDGLVSKGGGIERLRLPGPSQLRIGATDNRQRLRQLHEELEDVGRQLRGQEKGMQLLEAARRANDRLANPEAFASDLHEQALLHCQIERQYRARLSGLDNARSPDLIQLSERVQALQALFTSNDKDVERLNREQGSAERDVERAGQLLRGLLAQYDAAAQRAASSFREQDVDPEQVERDRDRYDTKYPTLEQRVSVCRERADAAARDVANLLPEAWSQLAQYGKDHALTIEAEPGDWRRPQAFLERELSQLRGTELANYQSQADEAYRTAVDTFRHNVVAALHDNFTRLRAQINTLNRTLRASPTFSNNERYQFHYEVIPAFRDLHAFIKRAVETGPEDTLFGNAGEVPEAFRVIIDDNATLPGVASSPLDDYRRFFRFEVRIQEDDRQIGTLSERMRSGSGGEHRAPLYVIAGAALAAAYGKTEVQSGGIGLILLDEFGDKIDAQNARATTNYLRSLGLQLVLAAPDTAQGTLSGVLDSYIELFRDDDLLQVERVEVTEAGRALLQSDQFDLHPELLEVETARIARERTPG